MRADHGEGGAYDRIQSGEGVLDYLADAKVQLNNLLNADEVIEKLLKDKKGVLSNIYNDCKNVTAVRKKYAEILKTKLLNELKDGDILIAAEISRLGRSLLEVMKILEKCLNKNCQVWTIKENYRLGNDIQSKVMAFAFGLSAEIERNLISQRTKASLDSIKARGKKLGRPFAAQSKKLKLSKNTKRVKELLDKGVSKSQIARIMDVQTITLRRFIQRMGW